MPSPERVNFEFVCVLALIHLYWVVMALVAAYAVGLSQALAGLMQGSTLGVRFLFDSDTKYYQAIAVARRLSRAGKYNELYQRWLVDKDRVRVLRLVAVVSKVLSLVYLDRALAEKCKKSAARINLAMA